MNKYLEKIMLDFQIDDNNFKSVESSLKTLSEFKLYDDKNIEKLKKDFEDIYRKELAIEKLQKDIATLRDLNTKESLKAASKLQKQLEELTGTKSEKEEQLKALKEFGSGKLAGIVASSLKSLKDLLDDSLDELDNMLSYSYLTDSSVRNLRFQYGFSGSQAYGYEKAMGLMGFSSMEDLMYANSEQMKMFNNIFTKYTEKYEQLYDSGFFSKTMEYQVEMEMFKLDMQHELIGFFIENKDVIITGMNWLIEGAKTVVKIFDFISHAFTFNNTRSQEERNRQTSEILNKYSSRNTSINVSNNFQNIAKENESWLANAGQLTYEPLLKIINEGE